MFNHKSHNQLQKSVTPVKRKNYSDYNTIPNNGGSQQQPAIGGGGS